MQRVQCIVSYLQAPNKKYWVGPRKGKNVVLRMIFPVFNLKIWFAEHKYNCEEMINVVLKVID